MNYSFLPEAPGVYLFKGKEGKVLYIGKSLNIKKRVKDHLQNSQTDTRVNLLISQSGFVDYVETISEIDALILEANLIKKYQPKFNVRLKDDKDYLYIKITNEPYPKIVTARKRNLKDSKNYFGPYPSGKTVRTTLRSLRKLFPFCSNPPNKNRLKKPCFYYHLNLCSGACVGKVSQTEYLKMIRLFVSFLAGRKNKIIVNLNSEMIKKANQLDFEQATKIRNQIQGIEYLNKPPSAPFLYEENTDFFSETSAKELENLKTILNLKKVPKRIECYDVSNLNGANAVSSMVVLTDGKEDKDEYRRFKIKVKGINDYAMIEETLRRRFKNDWKKPDLIIIDGGAGQLNTALKVLQELNINLKVIGLAKREEEIYLPEKRVPLRLPRESKTLHLLQRARDEAHRFAVTYHRKLRRKDLKI